MDDKDIVLSYMRKGTLLAPEALLAIKQGASPSAGGLVVTGKDVARDSVRILKQLTEKKKEITPEDFAAFYTSKFRQMRDIIMSRIQKEFVSLNKTGADRSDVYTIGIVKDIRQSDGKTVIEVEDTTASLPVIFDNAPAVALDDVVAVHAAAAGRVLYGKRLLYPDVPLRQPAKGSGRACFVSDLHLDETPKSEAEKFFSWLGSQDIKYLFIAGDTGDVKTAEQLIARLHGRRVFLTPGGADTDDTYPQLPLAVKGATCLSNPCVLEVNGLKILMIHNLPDDALRKRYLGESKCVLAEDFLPLADVPDIVHCGYTHKPHVANYKSITIVNSGSPLDEFRPVVVDFATREAVQVAL